MKRRISAIVHDALLARCIMERAKGNGTLNICDAAERLFESLWDRLTPDERREYEAIVDRARIEDALEEIYSTRFGPN